MYTAYHTRPTKARLAVLDVLRNGWERIFRLNQEALVDLETARLSKATQAILQSGYSEQDWDENTFLAYRTPAAVHFAAPAVVD